MGTATKPVPPHQGRASIGEAAVRTRPANWLRLALHRATVRRALLTALIVGCVLVAINHGPVILRGKVTAGEIFQICLTFTVPYIVSTVSSVSTRREIMRLRTETTDGFASERR